MKKLLFFRLRGRTSGDAAFASLQVVRGRPILPPLPPWPAKQFKFALADAMKKGPVVLYFYPAAFTPGCTIEAHNFADAMPDFEKLGATVTVFPTIPLRRWNKFSLTECRSKFPVAADASGTIMKN